MVGVGQLFFSALRRAGPAGELRKNSDTSAIKAWESQQQNIVKLKPDLATSLRTPPLSSIR
jgi:hypothetical protein